MVGQIEQREKHPQCVKKALKDTTPSMTKLRRKNPRTLPPYPPSQSEEDGDDNDKEEEEEGEGASDYESRFEKENTGNEDDDEDISIFGDKRGSEESDTLVQNLLL